MFAIVSDGSTEVPLAESKALVEALLPYCGQGRADPFDLNDDLAWELIKAFDKYDVSRPSFVRSAKGLG